MLTFGRRHYATVIYTKVHFNLALVVTMVALPPRLCSHLRFCVRDSHWHVLSLARSD